MKNIFLFLVLIPCFGFASQDSTKVDSTMNKDAVFTRPSFKFERIPIAIGGYAEANTSYFATDGVTEGLSFQMRRFTLYTYSRISNKLRFVSEIEFEDGAKEINIETAFLDLELHPLLTFRGGVVINPIGAFNQNHDGPKGYFVDRPIVATELIPSTWSNVGFGVHGRNNIWNCQWNYEVYLTNGFDDAIISNEKNRTWLGASKDNIDRFEENSNGMPLITAKTAMKHEKAGELGISWMGGVYNTFRIDGLEVDSRRMVDVYALDYTVDLGKNTHFQAEIAKVVVDVPSTFTQQYGNKQWGFYTDLTRRFCHKKCLGFEESAWFLSARFEFADYNISVFNETDGKIHHDVIGYSLALSWRPVPQTVLRFNYRYFQETDILGNPPAKTGGFQFGIATYF